MDKKRSINSVAVLDLKAKGEQLILTYIKPIYGPFELRICHEVVFELILGGLQNFINPIFKVHRIHIICTFSERSIPSLFWLENLFAFLFAVIYEFNHFFLMNQLQLYLFNVWTFFDDFVILKYFQLLFVKTVDFKAVSDLYGFQKCINCRLLRNWIQHLWSFPIFLCLLGNRLLFNMRFVMFPLHTWFFLWLHY